MRGEESLLFEEEKKVVFGIYGGGKDRGFYNARSLSVAYLAFPDGFASASDLSMTLLVDLV